MELSEIIREGGLQIMEGDHNFLCFEKGGGLQFFSCHKRDGHDFLGHNLV